MFCIPSPVCVQGHVLDSPQSHRLRIQVSVLRCKRRRPKHGMVAVGGGVCPGSPAASTRSGSTSGSPKHMVPPTPTPPQARERQPQIVRANSV